MLRHRWLRVFADRRSRLLAFALALAAAAAFTRALAGQSGATAPAKDLVASADLRLPLRAERVYSVLARSFSSDAAMKTVLFMARGGWRLPGNPAFDSAQDRIRRDLQDAGFRVVSARVTDEVSVRPDLVDGRTPPARATDVRGHAAPPVDPATRTEAGIQWYEEYALDTPAWEPVSATIAVAGTTGEGGETVLDMSRDLDRVSLCINSFSTPADGVRAPLVFVGRGSDAPDYANLDVRGSIVLGQADTGRLFEQAVRQRGAVGVLSTAAAPYTRPAETPDVVQWSSIRYDETAHAFGFKISPRLADRLRQQLQRAPVTLDVHIEARFHPAVANRTLVAEIGGRSRPGERVVLAAHVQEPGANDNASGCATLLEIARDLAHAIQAGAIGRPERTLTFIWGDEISQSRQWLRADPSRAKTTRYALSLDMTGEDVAKTGGSFLIEKQPDPSAVWVRPSDPHSEWGASTVTAESLRGNLLNDLHLAVCLRRARDTGWVVKANPYEGGSDHSVFLAAGIPALLDWHFTDRYYHTNLDTPDKTSPAEMANVGIAAATTAWLLASANEQDGMAVSDLVERSAIARLALETRQSSEAIGRATDARGARAREEAIFAAWQKWYGEALESVLALPAGNPSPALADRVKRAVARIHAQTLK